jgi:salicylate hydroxylase
MAIEDAAALGILFNKDHFRGDVEESLSVYNTVRLPRATRVQGAAARAAYNINERIGKLSPISSQTQTEGLLL